MTPDETPSNGQYPQQYDPQYDQQYAQQYDQQYAQQYQQQYDQQYARQSQQQYAPRPAEQKKASKGLIITLIAIIATSFLAACVIGGILLWQKYGESLGRSHKNSHGGVISATQNIEIYTEPETSYIEETTEPAVPYVDMKIAFITDVGNIDDHSYNQATYEGVCEFADLTGCECFYYKPTEDTDQARVDAMVQAIWDGYDTIVVAGYLLGPAVYNVANNYPDVNFLCLDISAFDLSWEGEEIPPNVCCVLYKEEQAGFLAGYAAVVEGYKELGFLGGMSIPAVVRYGYGFLQGADAAAAELGYDDVNVKYWYSGTFAPADEVAAKMDQWYAEGTEVVFCCGGGIYLSCLTAADANDGLMIGVDVDQSWVSDRFITSAMKEISKSAELMLTELMENDGEWPDYASGKELHLGIEDGCVGLPMETSRFDIFSQVDYETLYWNLESGFYSIDTCDSDPEVFPELNCINVDYQFD